MRLLIYIEIIMWVSYNICTYSEYLFYIPYFAIFNIIVFIGIIQDRIYFQDIVQQNK